MNLQQLDWQTIVALLIVMAAIAVLARKTWKTVFHRSTGGCGTACGSCPAAQSNGSVKATNLIQLSPNSPDVD